MAPSITGRTGAGKGKFVFREAAAARFTRGPVGMSSAGWPRLAHPTWRASAVVVYRLWRDTGFVVGALLSGIVADVFGLVVAIWVVAVVTAVGAAIVAVRMYETHPHNSPRWSASAAPHVTQRDPIARVSRKPGRFT